MRGKGSEAKGRTGRGIKRGTLRGGRKRGGGRYNTTIKIVEACKIKSENICSANR